MEISTFPMKHWFFSYRNTYIPYLPMFPCAWSNCFCLHMWVRCLCFSVLMCVHLQLMKRWRWQMRCGASRQRHSVSTDSGRLLRASLRCYCSGQEWGKDGQWQLKAVDTQVWVYFKRHKAAHSFCCVDMYVCNKKWMWKVWGLSQCKSSGVWLLKHSLWIPQSVGNGLACWYGGDGYNKMQDWEEAKVLQKWADTGRRKNRNITYCIKEFLQIRGTPWPTAASSQPIR